MRTLEQIQQIFPKAGSDTEIFYETFNKYRKDFIIETDFCINAFLAQVQAETGEALSPRRESLNYSTDSLKKTFSRYRRNPKWAERDGRNKHHRADQINIGNIAYADRIGNGDIKSGDGYRFRGGGYFQLTGRDNYKTMADVISSTIDYSITPEELEEKIDTPEVGCLSAMAFWKHNRCYTCTHIDCVTSKINKYTDTYEKRKRIYQHIALDI